ncbi:MAG: hypothetical protein ABSG41_29370 [Bryobacteraceae bacterium]
MAIKAKLDKRRVSLETGTIERFGPLAGGKIPVWLFVIDPGHLHVFSQEEIGKRVDLKIFANADFLGLNTRQERKRLGALRLRLIRSDIDPKKRRLAIPDEAFDACSEYLDRSCVWLEQSPQLDIFTATYKQKALALPASEVFPESLPEDEDEDEEKK